MVEVPRACGLRDDILSSYYDGSRGRDIFDMGSVLFWTSHHNMGITLDDIQVDLRSFTATQRRCS